MNKMFSRTVYLICLLFLLISIIPNATAQNKTIAIFGSSVAKGVGDTTTNGGYTGFIKQLLEKRGWSVVNVSRGGDNTVSIMPRYASQLLPVKAKYVILGLSLGNEGIYSKSETTRNRMFERYRSGLLHLIDLCREDGMIPVVTNCYARGDFEAVHYEATKKMNLIINTWNVPSINALGTIDNGSGNWLAGYVHDNAHPNVRGHREIFYAFVPSLFDALEAGKKQPYKIRSSRYLHLQNVNSDQPLSYTPDDTIHSFTVSLLIKAPATGTFATLKGKGRTVGLSFMNNQIQYRASTGKVLSGDTAQSNRGWIYVVLSHQWASGNTALYVNGQFAGMTSEHLDFNQFILGGNGGDKRLPGSIKAADFKDLLIFRSALNADEAKALYYDQLLQSSLEIYAPFDDAAYPSGGATHNYAQSMSKLLVNNNLLISKEE